MAGSLLDGPEGAAVRRECRTCLVRRARLAFGIQSQSSSFSSGRPAPVGGKSPLIAEVLFGDESFDEGSADWSSACASAAQARRPAPANVANLQEICMLNPLSALYPDAMIVSPFRPRVNLPPQIRTRSTLYSRNWHSDTRSQERKPITQNIRSEDLPRSISRRGLLAGIVAGVLSAKTILGSVLPWSMKSH